VQRSRTGKHPLKPSPILLGHLGDLWSLQDQLGGRQNKLPLILWV
jgi:hypothetical protein